MSHAAAHTVRAHDARSRAATLFSDPLSAAVSLKKEVQIHGEVNLKKHVQRLVAAQKYRDVPKTQRSYAVVVNGPSALRGKYERAGELNGYPLYKCPTGQHMWCEPGAGKWRISDSSMDDWRFSASVVPGVELPPRSGWEALNESRGVLAPHLLREAAFNLKPMPACNRGHRLRPDVRGSHRCDMCGISGTAYRCPEASCDYDMCKPCYEQVHETCQAAASSLAAEDVDAMIQKLLAKDSTGQEVVFRVRDGATLAEEWAKIGSALGSDQASQHVCFTPRDIDANRSWLSYLLEGAEDAEDLWTEGLESMRKSLKAEAALGTLGSTVPAICCVARGEASILETSHPYDAKRFQWRKQVHMDGAAALDVFFCQKSCTLDKSARFRIFSGGLRRPAAGAGSRVEITVPGAKGDKVWGTVAFRSEGRWLVNLDVQEEVDSDLSATDQTGWPAVGDEVEAKSGSWHRATISEVCEDGTFLVDWFDKDGQDRKKQRSEIRRPVLRPFDHRNLDDLPRFAAFPSLAKDRQCTAVCLDEPRSVHVRFAAGHSAVDEQGYTPMVGDEIASFALDPSCPLAPLSIGSFVAPGPAQEQGVAAGWYVDLVATLGGPSRSELSELLKTLGGCEVNIKDLNALTEAVFRNIAEVQTRFNEDLRAMRDITLIFTNSCSPKQVLVLPEAHVKFPDTTAASSEIPCFQLTAGSHASEHPPDTVTVGPHGCELKKFDNGSVTWWCDDRSPHCTRESEGPKVRWSCRTHGYDLCRGCVKHHMTNAKPLPVGLNVELASLTNGGCCHAAGVRADWTLDLRKTLHFNRHLKASMPDVFSRLTECAEEAAKKKRAKRKKKAARMEREAETADATPSEKPGKTKEELEELSPKLHDPGIETREFTLSWEEKDMFFEVVDRKMKALMSELGWSDPSELEGAVPFFDP
ncbi:HERC1, partial [Symbiodinium microadriaticum]